MKGGALYISDSSTVDIDECTFDRNTAVHLRVVEESYGGAIAQYESVVRISSSRFVACTTSGSGNGDGGALYGNGGTGFEITNCLFADNKARRDGGAIQTVYSSNTISASHFTNNTALRNGGALTGYNFKIEGSHFDSNRAEQDGGALRVSGSCVECNFTFNTALRGGAIATFEYVEVKDSVITACSATEHGAAVFSQHKTEISDSVVQGSNGTTSAASIFHHDAQLPSALFLNRVVFEDNEMPTVTATFDGTVVARNSPVVRENTALSNRRKLTSSPGFMDCAHESIGDFCSIMDTRVACSDTNNGVEVIMALRDRI